MADFEGITETITADWDDIVNTMTTANDEVDAGVRQYPTTLEIGDLGTCAVVFLGYDREKNELMGFIVLAPHPDMTPEFVELLKHTDEIKEHDDTVTDVTVIATVNIETNTITVSLISERLRERKSPGKRDVGTFSCCLFQST